MNVCSYSKIMRRFLSTLLLLYSLLPTSTYAQAGDFFLNSYLSMGVGPSLYLHNGTQSVGVNVNASYGKWILTTAGLRGQFMACYLLDNGGYLNADFDFFFDPITAIRGRNTSDVLRTYALLGMGVIHTLSGDNDFCGTVGMGADYRVGDRWRVFAEINAKFFPSSFDGNDRSAVMPMASAGLVRDIQFNPTRSRARNETKQLSNDWFFQIGLGANSFNYNGISGWSDRLAQMMPNFQFSIGKRLNTLWSVRTQMSGLYLKSCDETFSYYHGQANVMLDLATLVNRDFYRSSVTIRPFVGAGLVARLDDQSNFLFAVDGGAQLVYRPSHRNEIFVEAGYGVLPPRFAHVEYSQSAISVGIASFSIGYCYTFTKPSF